MLPLDQLLLEQILPPLLLKHYLSPLSQLLSLPLQPILLRLPLYRLLYLKLSKPPLVFDFLFKVILLLLHLLAADDLLVGHGLQLELLVNHEAVCGVGQLRVQPRDHLLGLTRQPLHLQRRVRLLHPPIHRLLGSTEVLIEHLVFDRVVSKLKQLSLLVRGND